MRTIGHVPPPLHPIAVDAVGTPHAPPRALFGRDSTRHESPPAPEVVAEALRPRPTEDPTFRPTFGPGVALVLAPVRRRYGDPLGRKGDTPFGNDEDKDIERIDRDGLVVGFREDTNFGWIYEVSYDDGDSDELTWPELLLVLTSPHQHASSETRAVDFQCHFPTRWGAAAAHDLLARALARYGSGAADETINFPTNLSYDTLLGVVLGGADDSNWTAARTRSRQDDMPPPRTDARRKRSLADRYDPGDFRVTSPRAKRRNPADADPRDPGSNPGANDATTHPKNIAGVTSARLGCGLVESGGRGRGAATASGSAGQRQPPPSTSPRPAPPPRPPRPHTRPHTRRPPLRPPPSSHPPPHPPFSSLPKPPSRGAPSPTPTKKSADPGFKPARSTVAEGAASSPRRAGPNAR